MILTLAVNGVIQLSLDETLDLDDTTDATKTRAFTKTFDEQLTLTDTNHSMSMVSYSYL